MLNFLNHQIFLKYNDMFIYFDACILKSVLHHVKVFFCLFIMLKLKMLHFKNCEILYIVCIT